MRETKPAPSLLEQGQLISSSLDDWARDMVPRLPAHLEQQAKALKAFERRRQIGGASDLLRGLLVYVFVAHSFQHLSIWSVLVGVADATPMAGTNACSAPARGGVWLLQEVLASTTQASPFLLQGGWRRVLLVDSTHFKCPGPQGMVWRVHTAFDLLAGRFTQLRVTDQHVGEQLELFDLHAGDLVVTDRANGLRQRVAFVLQQHADLLVRFTPRHFPLEEENGRRLEVMRWLKGSAAPAGRVLSRTVWMR